MQYPVSHGFLALLRIWALRKTSFHFPLVSLCLLSFKHQVQEKKLSLTAHFSRSGWGVHDKALRMPAWEAIETSQLMNRLHKHKHLGFFYSSTFTYNNARKEHTSK